MTELLLQNRETGETITIPLDGEDRMALKIAMASGHEELLDLVLETVLAKHANVVMAAVKQSDLDHAEAEQGLPDYEWKPEVE